MKRALFSLLAGLVSLSLAGCMLSLIATPTPSPTPLVSTPTAFPVPTETPHIPIPDTIIDEVGAPSEIKQFTGSAESLQPMIDAIAKQLGFTPAEGELAGFTVTGAKGEGNYFFVSHDGTVYTLFAHAQGGRFATVKVDGAGKTSDFAIFRMARFDRDAATVWWGIDDGQGGIIIPPMFEFQLNGDGSIAEVMFVEPKSGKSIQVSENTHQIQFESKVLFKLRQPLGGPEVAYMYDTNKAFTALPEGVTEILFHPSSPDVWQQPTGVFYSDGTPLPWGEFFVAQREDGHLLVFIPSLIRGVIEIPDPDPNIGGTIILPVFEIPAQGGSNFMVPYSQDNKFSTNPTKGIYTLKNGIPSNWVSSLDKPVPFTELQKGYTFTGLGNGRQMADLLKKQTGSMVLVSYTLSGHGTADAVLRQIVQQQLLNLNGQSQVEGVAVFNGVIFPVK